MTMTGQWLDDAFGPDGVRVTFRVEQAADRVIKEADQWGLFGTVHLLRSLSGTVDDGVHDAVEEVVTRGQWNLLVEADSGQKARATLPTQDEALALAERVSAAVRARGVAGMDELTH
jgi:hypothetical protein